MHTELLGDFRDRPARLDHNAYSTLTKLRRVRPLLGPHEPQLPLQSRTPRYEGRDRFLGRLATEGLRYLQLQEALGEPPTAKQFGSQRLTWPWSGEETEGWPILQHTIASLTQTAASASATGPADGGDPLVGQDDSTAPRALAKGANAALQPGHVAVRITTAGAPVDVSAVLLNSNGKVRDDNDLVFYNHPHHDGIHANGDTITADLGHIPTDVHTIAVIVSIDLQAEPTATFDRRTTWQADISQPNTRLRFRPDPFTSGETVIIAAEIYRRASDWKIRAVAQGYDTGLAGLATDYGINVEA
ncbi:TerD family protein [Streptomyces sp. NPDC005077]|uniref:TerD family protein n=1 Tax=Streptomyces sp. NPDC005077 TaxID=3154292 RepID=UPI00339E92C6